MDVAGTVCQRLPGGLTVISIRTATFEGIPDLCLGVHVGRLFHGVPYGPFLNLICTGHVLEVCVQGVEVGLAALDLVPFRAAEFELLLRALRFRNQVKLLAFLFHSCPVRVAGSQPSA